MDSIIQAVGLDHVPKIPIKVTCSLIWLILCIAFSEVRDYQKRKQSFAAKLGRVKAFSPIWSPLTWSVTESNLLLVNGKIIDPSRKNVKEYLDQRAGQQFSQGKSSVLINENEAVMGPSWVAGLLKQKVLTQRDFKLGQLMPEGGLFLGIHPFGGHQFKLIMTPLEDSPNKPQLLFKQREGLAARPNCSCRAALA